MSARVKVYVAPSGIHGVGVFAQDRIAAGTVVYRAEYSTEIVGTPDDELPYLERDWNKKYAWRSLYDGLWRCCIDEMKYVNHSFNPNCDDTGDFTTLALRDIAAGEELTVDYRAFNANAEDHIKPQELFHEIEQADPVRGSGAGHEADGSSASLRPDPGSPDKPGAPDDFECPVAAV